MRKKAAAELIVNFQTETSELEQLRKQEVERRVQAERTIRESNSADAKADAQLATIRAQIAGFSQ